MGCYHRITWQESFYSAHFNRFAYRIVSYRRCPGKERFSDWTGHNWDRDPFNPYADCLALFWLQTIFPQNERTKVRKTNLIIPGNLQVPGLPVLSAHQVFQQAVVARANEESHVSWKLKLLRLVGKVNIFLKHVVAR